MPVFLLQLYGFPVSYNLTSFRLHCLHQAPVRLHQRVKVTTLSCFPASCSVALQPTTSPSLAGLLQPWSSTHPICLSRHYRNVEKSLLRYWPALMKGRWVFWQPLLTNMCRYLLCCHNYAPLLRDTLFYHSRSINLCADLLTNHYFSLKALQIHWDT